MQGCSALECSCALPESSWTSTAYQPDASKAWVVDFYQGRLLPIDLHATTHMRAVRGGVHVGTSSPPPSSPAAPLGKAPASLAACQKTVATETVNLAGRS